MKDYYTTNNVEGNNKKVKELSENKKMTLSDMIYSRKYPNHKEMKQYFHEKSWKIFDYRMIWKFYFLGLHLGNESSKSYEESEFTIKSLKSFRFYKKKNLYSFIIKINTI